MRVKNDGRVEPVLRGSAIGFIAGAMLAATERRLIERAEEIVLLLVSSKYEAASGGGVCSLSDVDTVIADDRIDPEVADMIRDAGAPLKIVLV